MPMSSGLSSPQLCVLYLLGWNATLEMSSSESAPALLPAASRALLRAFSASVSCSGRDSRCAAPPAAPFSPAFSAAAAARAFSSFSCARAASAAFAASASNFTPSSFSLRRPFTVLGEPLPWRRRIVCPTIKPNAFSLPSL